MHQDPLGTAHTFKGPGLQRLGEINMHLRNSGNLGGGGGGGDQWLGEKSDFTVTIRL